MSKSSLLLLVPLMGCVSSPADPEPDPEPDAGVVEPVTNVAGKHTHTLEVDGLTREVIVYVPELDDETLAVPAVLMFHGTSGDGERFYDISGWRDKSDEVGMISVYPSALTHCFFEDDNRDGDFDDAGERKTTTKWASGEIGTEVKPLCTEAELAELTAENRARADHPLADDLAFFDAILDLLATEYVVDAHRIYASGFSNGAQMTGRLAVERADRLAAAAMSGGGLGLEPAPSAWPISMVYSVGTMDDRYLEFLEVEEIPITETVFEDTPGLAGSVRPMLEVLQLAETYTFTEELGPGGKRIGTYLFEDSLVGADNSLTFALVEDAYHVYPNGENHALAIVNPLWAFFETQSLP